MFEISKSSLYELYKETENVAVDTLINGVDYPVKLMMGLQWSEKMLMCI